MKDLLVRLFVQMGERLFVLYAVKHSSLGVTRFQGVQIYNNVDQNYDVFQILWHFFVKFSIIINRGCLHFTIFAEFC